MEIIKNTVRLGNSAGVLLPKKWLNSQVKILLEPLNIEKDIINILLEERLLKSILGVYVIGSYAREEQNIDSDVDVLVITNNINKRIKRGKYEIICISKKEVENQLNKNALPLLPMIKESKVIVNEDLIKKYVNWKLNKRNLKYIIETTKSAMQVVKKDIEIAKQIKGLVSDASAYSLILRLRTLYILDCIKKNKTWKKKEFLKLVKKISGSLNAYERYVYTKDKNTLNYKISVEEAEKLMDYINQENQKTLCFTTH